MDDVDKLLHLAQKRFYDILERYDREEMDDIDFLQMELTQMYERLCGMPGPRFDVTKMEIMGKPHWYVAFEELSFRTFVQRLIDRDRERKVMLAKRIASNQRRVLVAKKT